MDIKLLEKELRAYPDALRDALLYEMKTDEAVAQLRAEMTSLEVGPDLEEDAKMLKLNKEMERLRQRKHAAILADPRAFNLAASSLTKNKIDIVLSQDEDVVELEQRIEARQEALLSQVGEEAHQQMLDEKKLELAQLEQTARAAQLEREILQNAYSRLYDWLVQLHAGR